ncbi:MAG: hypothetical protein CVU39_07825 [Chloroflexi bacterium HGW-Chloroflexi-10]|nr:MAG: hypothetical protein CVU39_07825 [Chloroflexi bacterium HGW-Chloroflexi-10]
MNNILNQSLDTVNSVQVKEQNLLNTFFQNALIVFGSVLLIIAFYNTLFDLRIISIENFQAFQHQQLASIQSETSNLLTRQEKANEIINPVSENALVSVLSTPTAIATQSTNEADGFLPVRIEQIQDEAENPETIMEVVLVVPRNMIIPAIDLDAPIIEAAHKDIAVENVNYIQWNAPDEYAVGWHSDSAGLGQIGNMVFNGHHNVYGEVFKDLDKLVVGDLISVYGDDFKSYSYIVTNVIIVPERDASVETRLENARWIMPSADERLTIVTCWPSYSNTHRLIIAASPVE